MEKRRNPQIDEEGDAWNAGHSSLTFPNGNLFMRRANSNSSGGRRGALGAVYAYFRLIARHCSMGTTGRFPYLGGFSRRDNAEGTRPRRVVEHVLQTGLALTSTPLSLIEPSVQQMRSNSDSVPVG